MIPLSHFTVAPDATMGDESHVVPSAPPIFVEGILFEPTGHCDIADGTATKGEDGDETHFITVMIAAKGVGLHHPLTPKGARDLAEGLMRAAKNVDRMIAEKASAAIERARKQGGAA